MEFLLDFHEVSMGSSMAILMVVLRDFFGFPIGFP